MKYGISVFVTLLFIIAGCSSEPLNLYEIDESKVSEQLNGISFEYLLPSGLPFEAESIQAGQPITNSSEVFVVEFYGEDGQMISMNALNREVTPTLESKSEEIEVGDYEGKYFNENSTEYLFWEVEGVTYILTLPAKESNEDLGKSNLLTIAENFQ
ncbi:DUF4367 domain-containing protein [Halobacillus yeomjeoni]|uniref:DUF4367 domain-containing protein n=1 Tax=Halobacillus yeomjeoni TaxID=311194 RepID=UPI001CD54946|nr:DUF4367 domain-containing protein [Halobacillus yeomjeoni]MCA0984232.1 DUF4367 domain-containing protein [Halobacillus yeomjeoni]